LAEKENFYSFEEALRELRLKEEELKRLVSEGEIRAFREGDTMRLRRADVDSLRAELSGGEVVDLGDAEDELIFEDDVPMAGEPHGEAGLATQEMDVADLEAGMATQELEAAPDQAATVIDEGLERALREEGGAEEGGAEDEFAEDEFAEDEFAEDEFAEDETGAGLAAAPARASRAAPAAEEEYEGGLPRMVLVVTAVLLFLGVPLFIALGTGEVNAVAGALSGLFE
jgi:excisionase family DNA binding protein